jgi:predicted dehydrogenase
MTAPAPPRPADPLRWGILGTGDIAASFVTDLARLDDHVVASVGSRSATAADAFGERHGIPRRHGSYAALVEDDGVDVVYVATPHPFHRENALLAIAAGKHVLVEKPFALNAVQGREVFAAARARGVFVMEAMWTRFLPWVVDLLDLVADGTLGELTAVSAEFGVLFAPDPSSRLMAPELGGGSLLDLGVYPLSLACLLLGAPETLTAVSVPTATGVDARTSVLMTHAGGTHALVSSSMVAAHANRATVVGTEGRVEVDPPFFTAGGFDLTVGGTTSRHEHPADGTGLRHQAVEVARCVRTGLTESPHRTHADTLVVLDAMDDVRRQIGLRYPGE